MWGEFVTRVMYLVNVIKRTKDNFPWIGNTPQTPPPPSPTLDLETGYSALSVTTAEGKSNNESPHYRPFVNLVMNNLLNVIKLTKAKLNFPWICDTPQTPPPSPTVDLETGYSAHSATAAEGQSNNERPNCQLINVPWKSVGVCVAAVGITVQALQSFGLSNSLSFHWICMALVFSLTAVVVSIDISGIYKRASLLVVRVGIFIVFTALVVALVANLKLPFKVISVAVYVIGILIIISANLCKPKP